MCGSCYHHANAYQDIAPYNITMNEIMGNLENIPFSKIKLIVLKFYGSL